MKKINYRYLLLPLMFLSAHYVKAQSKELSLVDALQLAKNGNRQLQIKWLENRKAIEAKKEAKSYLLPSVGANGGYNVYGERPVIYLRNESGSPKLDDVKYGGRFVFESSIYANYALVNPVVISNLKSSAISEKISWHEAQYSEEELLLSVSHLYLSVLLHSGQLKLLQQSLQRNERALADSRSLFFQGKNLKTDTLSNYISVQNLGNDIAALRNNIHVLSVQLKQLMGMEDSTVLVFADSLRAEVPTITHTDLQYAQALNSREDVKIKSLQIEQAKEQLNGVRSAFKPQLHVVAQYQVQSQSDNLNFGKGGFPRTSFAGLKLNIPIYSGNRLKYKSSASEFTIRQQELAYDELKSTVRSELVSLQANLVQAINQLKIQQQNVEAAQLSYSMMNERYHHGLGSRLELSDAELALTKAKLAELQSVYSIRMIEMQINKAIGDIEMQNKQ